VAAITQRPAGVPKRIAPRSAAILAVCPRWVAANGRALPAGGASSCIVVGNPVA